MLGIAPRTMYRHFPAPGKQAAYAKMAAGHCHSGKDYLTRGPAFGGVEVTTYSESGFPDMPFILAPILRAVACNDEKARQKVSSDR